MVDIVPGCSNCGSITPLRRRSRGFQMLLLLLAAAGGCSYPSSCMMLLRHLLFLYYYCYSLQQQLVIIFLGEKIRLKVPVEWVVWWSQQQSCDFRWYLLKIVLRVLNQQLFIDSKQTETINLSVGRGANHLVSTFSSFYRSDLILTICLHCNNIRSRTCTIQFFQGKQFDSI